MATNVPEQVHSDRSDGSQKPSNRKEPTEYEKFLQWYVMPKDERDRSGLPTNVKQYAQVTGTDLETISDYLDRPSWGEDVTEAALSWGKAKSRKIIQWAYRRVRSEKELDDMEQFIDIMSKLEKKQQEYKEAENKQVNNYINVDPNQYKQILKREASVIDEGGEEEAA